MPLTTNLVARQVSDSASTPLAGRRDRDWVFGLGILLLCFAYLCLFLRYSTLEPDEGIVLQGAERILRGELPYRDFFSFYTPGSFYLVAFIFRVFGDSFLAARLSLAISGALCSLITYLLARRVCSRQVSILAALLATTAGSAFRFLVLHNQYSTLFCSLAVYAALRLFETRRNLWAIIAGCLVSFTFLCEQSKGVGLCVGLVLATLILGIHWAERSAWISLFLGFTLPLLAVLLYFSAHHAAQVMLADWFWPLRHYTQANHVPYGWQNWSDRTRESIFQTGPWWLRVVKVIAVFPVFILPAIPLLAIGILFYWRQQSRATSNGGHLSSYYVLLCSICFGLLISVIGVRADVLHFMYLAPLWYVVLAWILGSQEARSPTLLQARPGLICVVIVSFGLLSLALLFTATGARSRIQSRKGSIKAHAADTVIDYIQAHSETGTALLVYPYLPLYNYLTATHSPSRYDYFQPGMNTPTQAQEVLASLVRKKPPVLFEPWFPEKFANSWPNTPVATIANDPVADYIVRNYRTCKILTSPESWRFHYMVPRDQTCPEVD